MAKQEEKTVKPIEHKEETPNAKPVTTVGNEEVKEAPIPKAVTKDESSNTIEVSGETILNGGKNVNEGNAKEGIDEKAEGAKDTLDTQKKAEEAIKEGTSGLDPISIAEVQGGLIKDTNSDRPVYASASAATAALKASGKLAGE